MLLAQFLMQEAQLMGCLSNKDSIGEQLSVEAINIFDDGLTKKHNFSAI